MSEVTAADSSIAVAAFGEWNESFETAVLAVAAKPRLVAHAALEAYSVLTRLPEPYRAAPETVAGYLAGTFGAVPITLAADDQLDLPRVLSKTGIVGGAAYDGLVAFTAKLAGARLLSLDQRAAITYQRIGVEFEILG